MRPNQIILTAFSLLLLSPLGFAATTPQAVASPTAQASAKTMLAAVDASDSSNPSTKQIESTVHQYLMKKPEVIVEALQAYQQKQMVSMQELFKNTQKEAPKYADTLFHEGADPVGGNAKGPVTLVEFSDYQCSHCIETSGIVMAASKSNPNLRVVIKEFPIRGPISETAAKAALASNKQGKYWTFREVLFKNGMALNQDKIFELAKSIGLNVDQLKKDMEDPAIRAAVAANQKLAQNLKLMGTPAFFIAKSTIKTGAPDGSINYIPGVVTEQQLQAIIKQVNH